MSIDQYIVECDLLQEKARKVYAQATKNDRLAELKKFIEEEMKEVGIKLRDSKECKIAETYWSAILCSHARILGKLENLMYVPAFVKPEKPEVKVEALINQQQPTEAKISLMNATVGLETELGTVYDHPQINSVPHPVILVMLGSIKKYVVLNDEGIKDPVEAIKKIFLSEKEQAQPGPGKFRMLSREELAEEKVTLGYWYSGYQDIRIHSQNLSNETHIDVPLDIFGKLLECITVEDLKRAYLRLHGAKTTYENFWKERRLVALVKDEPSDICEALRTHKPGEVPYRVIDTQP